MHTTAHTPEGAHAPDVVAVHAATRAIALIPAYTPATHIHTPASRYARYFLLPSIGPTGLLLWERLVEHLATDAHGPVVLAWDEVAHCLGTTPGRAARILDRLAVLGHVELRPTPDPDVPLVAVRRAAPELTHAQLRWLAQRCPALAATHTRAT